MLDLRASPEHAKATGFWFIKMGLHADPFQSLSCHPTRNERIKRRTGVIKKRKDVHGADGEPIHRTGNISGKRAGGKMAETQLVFSCWYTYPADDPFLENVDRQDEYEG